MNVDIVLLNCQKCNHQCLKGHKYLGLLFEDVLKMSLSLSSSFSLHFRWSCHVSSSLLSHVSRVTSLSECSLVVFFKTGSQ